MVSIDVSSLRESKPHEYAARFLFGGACTVLAGLMAKRFGPEIGGLFLAFPAIFPASASLIESHEKRRKAKAGFDGTIRGRIAASVDAAGTSFGCIGLIGFALILWIGLPRFNAFGVVVTGAVGWALIAGALWTCRNRHICRLWRNHRSAFRH
jgi:hypothetical protein